MLKEFLLLTTLLPAIDASTVVVQDNAEVYNNSTVATGGGGVLVSKEFVNAA